MVDATRRGDDLNVKGTSDRGTQSTEQCSLKGLARALNKIERECKQHHCCGRTFRKVK
jgi:hypothetical protein